MGTMAMRVGIATGPIVAGALGSSGRMKYTTVGDNVNIAARLESYDKESIEWDTSDSPCRILIADSTMSYLDNQFKIRRVGETKLKGKAHTVTIFRVLGKRKFPEERSKEDLT
jgi:adenylate cyclase